MVGRFCLVTDKPGDDDLGRLGDEVDPLEDLTGAEQPAAVPPGAVTCFHVFPDGSDKVTPVRTTTDRSSARDSQSLVNFNLILEILETFKKLIHYL